MSLPQHSSPVSFRFSFFRMGLLITIAFAFFMTSGSFSASADPLARGVQGAVGGALIGGLVGGGKGAARGAMIGSAVGIIGGAIEVDKRRKYYRKYNRARGHHLRSSTLVYETQISLMRLGYHTGRPDGFYGRRTSRAIVIYQRKHGLPVTGRPSLFLLRHMHSHGG